MNEGQEKFFGYIMDRVKDGKLDDAKVLLEDMFKKQDDGSMNSLHLAAFIPKITGMLKTEHIKEATALFEKFAKGV